MSDELREALERFREATADVGPPEDDPIVEIVPVKEGAPLDKIRDAMYGTSASARVLVEAMKALRIPDIAAQHQTVLYGATTDRPAPGEPGRLFEDALTGHLYRDEGDEWVDITRMLTV